MDFLYLLINLLDFTLDLQGIKFIAWWVWVSALQLQEFILCITSTPTEPLFSDDKVLIYLHTQNFSPNLFPSSHSFKVIPTRPILFCLLLCFTWNRVNLPLRESCAIERPFCSILQFNNQAASAHTPFCTEMAAELLHTDFKSALGADSNHILATNFLPTRACSSA